MSLTSMVSMMKNTDLGRLSLEELVLLQSLLDEFAYGYADAELPDPEWLAPRRRAINEAIKYQGKQALRDEQERLEREAKELMSRSDRLAEVKQRLEEVSKRLSA